MTTLRFLSGWSDPVPSANRKGRAPAWRHALRLALGSMLATAAIWLSPLSDLENDAGLSLLYGLRGAASPPQDVLIVAIDSASAKALGLAERPDAWPRSVHARLVSGLAASGAAVIGFDMLFNAPRAPDEDAALSTALRDAGNVVLAEAVRREFLTAPDGRILATTDQRILPLPQLADAAFATAPFVVPKTPDGVSEFWTLIPSVGDRPSLPMVMAQKMSQRAQGGAEQADPARRGLNLRSLNLYGPPGTVRTIPYARALALVANRSAGAAIFGGKAVLIGYSESNPSKQADTHRTPYSTADGVDVSGVELCATALANLLDASWLRRPSDLSSLVLVLLCAAVLALPWALARPVISVLITAAIATAYGAAAYLAFARSFVWLPVVVPLVFSPVLAGALGIVTHYRKVQKRRIELERAVDLGLPRQAMERLSAMLGEFSEGRTALTICLCSDIVSYTTISESLSPEETRNLLNRYLARFIPVVERYGGYASDMVGDSVMSLWVADVDSAATFHNACAAALELDRAMNVSTEDGALRTRFGLHCGLVYVGEVGGGSRREIRAVGDIVNTASRIEGANKYLGTCVLASADFAARLDPRLTRAVGRFGFVGKTQPLELLELVGSPLPETAERAFAAGLAAFRAGNFATAAERFAAAKAAGYERPAAFYLDQCVRMGRSAGAPDWNGVVALPGK
jgi:adenylate cyclase